MGIICCQSPGAGDRSRTYDLRITNALLYQLSYTGILGAAEESRTLDLYLGKVSLYQLSYCRFSSIAGGVDGARTRDPRRDRPVF